LWRLKGRGYVMVCSGGDEMESRGGDDGTRGRGMKE
jgi:hypothetical protein